MLTIFSGLCTGSTYRNPSIKTISTTYKLLQSSSPHYLCDLITVQPSQSTRSSTLVTLLRQPVHSSLKITNRSFRHLTCETGFLLLFVFLISLVRYHHSAVLHRQALIVHHLLTFLNVFSTLLLKPSFFSVFPSQPFIPC